MKKLTLIGAFVLVAVGCSVGPSVSSRDQAGTVETVEEDPEYPPKDVCKSDEECPDDGFCLDGQCQTTAICGRPTDGGYCSTGSTCASGYVRAPSWDFQCPTSRRYCCILSW